MKFKGLALLAALALFPVTLTACVQTPAGSNETSPSDAVSENAPQTDAPETAKPQYYVNPVTTGADPFVLLHDGCYYLYATNAVNEGYRVSVSTDLVHWEDRGLCLSANDVAGSSYFFAPEVMYYNGKFYMAYAADMQIGIAVSDSPLGPFKQEEKKFLFNYQCIDGSFFVDDDGRVYLYYVRFTNKGNEIAGIELNKTITGVVGSEQLLISATESYEKVQGSITEGPYMLKHNGLYYLVYSANDYQSKSYCVCYAMAKKPLPTTVPFVRYEGNPILSQTKTVCGTGHCCFTRSLDGSELFIVYHRHASATQIHERTACIDRAYFAPSENGGPDVLTIKGPTSTRQPYPSGNGNSAEETK